MCSDPQPVRRRTFTGCKTCRRRHAKCDEAQPECSTCQRLGLPCEGYEPRLLWIMDDTTALWTTTELRKSHRGAGFRYPLFPEDVRQRMTNQLEQSMSNRSAMSVLLQIDCESEAYEDGKQFPQDLMLGPFGVFSMRPKTPIADLPLPVESDGTESLGLEPEPINHRGDPIVSDVISQEWPYSDTLDLDMFMYTGGTSLSDDSPEDFGTFDPTLSLASGAADLPLPTTFDSHETSTANQELFSMTEFIPMQPLPDVDSTLNCSVEQTEPDTDTQTAMITPRHMPSFETHSVPDDAAHLLRCYRENINKTSVQMQTQRSSPWQILFLPCALETFAELSLFGKASHTRSAMFYAILSISALRLALTNLHAASSTHWIEAGSRHRDKAQWYLREALQTEVSGKNSASYKELLMAMLSCAMMSLYEKPKNFRYFLLDAERLIRYRGLGAKKSYQIRLLHHMYSYLRVMAESTGNCAEIKERSEEQYTLAAPSGVTLRGFQVTEASLTLNIDPASEKSSEIGYNDIHLEIQGVWKESLYTNIYGIPESLITLLSQTIALANDKVRLERVAQKDGKVATALASHTKSLENSIWAWKLPEELRPLEECGNSPHGEHNSREVLDHPKMRAMASAMHQAVLIYFYRRIYNVNAMMLQDMVKRTLDHLQVCVHEDMEDPDFATSMAWPGFVAACEAVSPDLQKRATQSLAFIEASSTVFSPEPASQVVAAVWEQRSQTGDYTRSWPDVMPLAPACAI